MNRNIIGLVAVLASATTTVLAADARAETIVTETEISYDEMGRVKCTTVRMNPTLFGSVPADACALKTEGVNGPDRITKNVYDAAGQLLQERRAVGTPLEQAYVTYTYTLTGKREYVIDANGQRAKLEYDGFDRQTHWYFPSPVSPAGYNSSTPANALATAGVLSATDYEQYGYDANGNRTSLRKRDGRTIAYSYDALNRVASKAYPSGGARAVYYAYDLRGLQTAARFDSSSGSDAILGAWDGFGRQVSSTISMGGVSRTLGYTSDANGNRIKVEHPDGTYAYTYYDGLDRSYYTVVNGPPVLQSYYDAQGRVYAMDRWRVSASTWGMGTTYTFDGISRLAAYGHWFQNSAANVSTAFTHNPASQIVSRSRNNDDYRFTGNVNIDRAYAANGLNQYSTAGSASFTYDANGNLTSDGTTGYTYDIENRLIGTSTGVVLTYDPLGRLWQTYSPATGATQFLYDGDALVAEYDGAGAMLKRYVHGPAAGQDDPLVEYVGSGTSSPRYLFADHQGSIIAIADSNGNRIAVNGYDEYGIPNGFAGSGTPNTGRFQYTGQAWIPELGMYHYKARIYSPTLGRFLQTDPVGYEDQINLYLYAGNDPVNSKDPDGTTTINCHIVIDPDGASSAKCQAPIDDGKSEYTFNIKKTKQSLESDGSISSSSYTSSVEVPWYKVALFGEQSYIKSSIAGVLGVSASSIVTLSSRNSLMGQASNPRLKGVINELYRPKARIGSGSAMDAYRAEGAGGRHGQKLVERRTQLMRLLRDPNLSSGDRKIVKDLLIDIQNSLSGR